MVAPGSWPPSERHVEVVVGTPVDVAGFEQALDWVAAAIAARRGTYLSHANAFSLRLAHRDPRHRERLAGAGFVAADGMPVVWAQRRLGHAAAERVHGDDLFLAACDRFRQVRHFLLGGAAGQPENVAQVLAARLPGLEVVGVQATPRRPPSSVESERALAAFRATAAEVVWVGMGTPSQDEWMAAHAAAAGIPLIGVGSAFDVLSGRRRPAPEWVKRSGLQWLFRLLQEPRRLGGRYLVGNSWFAAAFLAQWLAHRRREAR
jgi:N-acetylglucosaminyldiphosphoundecaprenol N-acetyl-beta-D-mannosaminyltransferase